MLRAIVATILCGTAISSDLLAQRNETGPPRPAGVPSMPPRPRLPPADGPGALDASDAGLPAMPGAPAGVGARGVGAPAGVGARPLPPLPQETNEVRSPTTRPAPTTSESLILFLDSTAPFVQAFDCLLMLVCGVYCLRSSKPTKNRALGLMAIACFVSTIILLGFFLSATYHGHALLPVVSSLRVVAYLTARLLAPIELLLFAIAILLVARSRR